MKKVTAFTIVLLAMCATTSQAQTFEVNSLRGDTDLNDEIITLADAVTIANTIPGPDTIVFSPALKGTIQLKKKLEVTESLEISGPGAAVLTVYIPATTDYNRHQIFSVSEATENFTLSGLTLKRSYSSTIGHPAPISSHATNNTVTGVILENFKWGLSFQHAQSVILDNLEYVQCESMLRSQTEFSEEAISTSISIKNTLFRDNTRSSHSHDKAIYISQDNGDRTGYQSDNTTVILDGVRITGNNYFTLSASDDSAIEIKNSSFDNNKALYVGLSDGNISFTNTTIYNNEKTSIYLNDASGSIDFSTIFYNAGNLDLPIVSVSNSDLDIGHSVITVTQNGAPVIESTDSSINVAFSMIGVTSIASGSPINYDAVSLSNLLRFPQFEAALQSVDGRRFAIIPASPGNLIDAGDSSAVAGVDGIPEFDQIGSTRIIGSAPDIGTTEYNRPPQFDVDAFTAAVKEAVAATPDGTIEIALMDYFSDPDGHTIIEINVYNTSDGLTFDAGAWTLSGTAEAFTRPQLVAIATDEYQLKGGGVVGAQTGSGSSDSGGSVPVQLVMALASLLLARRQARPHQY